MSAMDDFFVMTKSTSGETLVCYGVPQGFYFKGQPTSDVGTSSLASCCAVVGVNEGTSTVFFAHVDAGKSPKQVLDLLNEIAPDRIEIYRGSSKSKPIASFIDELNKLLEGAAVVTDLDSAAVVLKIDGLTCVVCGDITATNKKYYSLPLTKDTKDKELSATPESS